MLSLHGHQPDPPLLAGVLQGLTGNQMVFLIPLAAKPPHIYLSSIFFVPVDVDVLNHHIAMVLVNP